MATSLRPSHASFDAPVPFDDVPTDDVTMQRTGLPATRIVVEIGGSAAWLAWQIDAGEVLVHEARTQLQGIGSSLERYRGRMPDAFRDRMIGALRRAHAAADQDDLHAVAASAREIRALAEQYRATATSR
jgi:hypothetical protein